MRKTTETLTPPLPRLADMGRRGISRSAACRKAERLASKTIGEAAAVKIGFIPHMIMGVAFGQALKFHARARDIRSGELKKAARFARETAESYERDMERALGPEAWECYKMSWLAFASEARTDVWLAEMKLREDAANQLPGKDAEAAAHAALMGLAAGFAEAYECQMDAMLREKLGRPVEHRIQPHLLCLLKISELVKGLGWGVEPSPQARRSLEVLRNRAFFLADEICARAQEEGGER